MEKKGISAREVALKTLFQVEEQGAYANLALTKTLRQGGLKKIDRGFVTELVYGTVRTRNTLEWMLQHFLNRPLGKVAPWMRLILILGAYQLVYTSKVPPAAACNEAVELAKKYGHQGTVRFVNGVLRSMAAGWQKLEFPSLATDPVEHISLKYSHPAWMVSRWLSRFGQEQTIALCRTNNQPAGNAVRTNTLRVAREQLALQLASEGVEAIAGSYVPECLLLNGFTAMDQLAAFQNGLFTIQDEASQLVAHILRPEPGQLVVDACAAPGSKTTHLAQLMGDKGKIIAWDIHDHKLALIRDNCRRLGITSVETRHGDARGIGLVMRSGADCVLVDAPCLGSGVWRRRPDSRWKKKSAHIEELKQLQREILQGVVPALKSGGVLVYSTCSMEPEENQENVELFLRDHPDIAMEDISPYLPFNLEREADRCTAKVGYLQMLPHVHGTDGFFIARFRRA